jgi:hypothetical protein
VNTVEQSRQRRRPRRRRCRSPGRLSCESLSTRAPGCQNPRIGPTFLLRSTRSQPLRGSANGPGRGRHCANAVLNPERWPAARPGTLSRKEVPSGAVNFKRSARPGDPDALPIQEGARLGDREGQIAHPPQQASNARRPAPENQPGTAGLVAAPRRAPEQPGVRAAGRRYDADHAAVHRAGAAGPERELPAGAGRASSATARTDVGLARLERPGDAEVARVTGSVTTACSSPLGPGADRVPVAVALPGALARVAPCGVVDRGADLDDRLHPPHGHARP